MAILEPSPSRGPSRQQHPIVEGQRPETEGGSSMTSAPMPTRWQDLPLGYYAVPDPDDPHTMTYWRRASPRRREVFDPWPAGTKTGPVLYTRDVPTGLKGEARREWIRAWYAEVHKPYRDAVIAAIAADTDAAAQRFAQMTSRCCVCGRSLTDESSKVYGIGPECREGMSPEHLDRYVRQTGAAHVQALVEQGGLLDA